MICSGGRGSWLRVDILLRAADARNRRDDQRRADLAAAQQRIEFLRRLQEILEIHHVGFAERGDHFARMRRLRLVEHGGGQVADIEVDRVAEQQQLHRRNADDHRERQAIAAQLAQFLDDDREQAAQVHGGFSPRRFRASACAVTNTSSRLGRSVPRKLRCRRSSGIRDLPAGIVAPRVSTRRCAPICAIATMPGPRRSARPARRRGAFAFDQQRRAGQLARVRCGLPSATSRPWSRIARRWQRSASSM